MTVISKICQIGQGAKCCRYIMLDKDGFFCAKSDPSSKMLVDSNWNETKSAQGDNCEGLTREELQK